MRINQRASELHVSMLAIRQLLHPWAILLCLMTSSCAVSLNRTTPGQHRYLVASIDDLQSLEYYLNVFDQEIKNGNEADMEIMIDGLNDDDIHATFKRISNSVKDSRFIGVIQPARAFQHQPEGISIKYEMIKFHVHNTRHYKRLPGSDGISSLEIAIIKKPHLAIM